MKSRRSSVRESQRYHLREFDVGRMEFGALCPCRAFLGGFIISPALSYMLCMGKVWRKLQAPWQREKKGGEEESERKKEKKREGERKAVRRKLVIADIQPTHQKFENCLLLFLFSLKTRRSLPSLRSPNDVNVERRKRPHAVSSSSSSPTLLPRLRDLFYVFFARRRQRRAFFIKKPRTRAVGI